MLKEKSRLEKQVVELQRKIEKLPEGKLIKGRNGKYNQWFQSDGDVIHNWAHFFGDLEGKLKLYNRI